MKEGIRLGIFFRIFQARYLTEDIPYGLVVTEAIAQLAGFKRPRLTGNCHSQPLDAQRVSGAWRVARQRYSRHSHTTEVRLSGCNDSIMF